MQTKTIDKLEELIGEDWNFNKKKFKLEKSYMVGTTVVLHMLNNKENTNGEEEDKPVFWVNEKNYKELEFYGLKVILNEKPKLTRKERNLLECIDENVYMSRDYDGTLVSWSEKPEQRTEYGFWQTDKEDYKGLLLSDGIFNFITWESGKAWSKAELLELEVVE